MKTARKIIIIVLCVIGFMFAITLTVYAKVQMWEKNREEQCVSTVDNVTEDDYPVEEQMFDTEPLLAWCGDPQQGVLRMIGAMYYGVDDEGYTLVVDEVGQVWSIYQDIDEEDFLLLWIADTNTPDCYDDDVVVKVWREAY